MKCDWSLICEINIWDKWMPDLIFWEKECQTLHGCGGCFTYRMNIFVTKIGIQFLKKNILMQ